MKKPESELVVQAAAAYIDFLVGGPVGAQCGWAYANVPYGSSVTLKGPPLAPTRAHVVAAARRLIDTPFHHQGRLPGVGLDCAGVPISISWELGLLPRSFDVTGYSRTPDGESLKAYCDQYMTQIPRAAMQPGDVVLVRWRDGAPQHLGVLADWRHGDGVLSIIHADSLRQKRVIETRLVFGNMMQFVAAYALPGVA